MADVISNDVSWCGQQATDVIIKPVFYNEDITRFVDVHGDIKSTKQLALDEILEDVVRPSSGCGRDVSGGPISIEEKYITLCDAKINLDQCAKNLKNTFMEEMLRTGNDIFDLTGTDLESYILKKVTEALGQDVPKIFWMGDTSLVGSFPTIGTCDGIWKRLINAGSYVVPKPYDFPDGPLGECEALDAFRALAEGASDLLDQLPENQKYFAVTRSVYENYMTCLEERCCGDRGTIRLEDGSTRLFFRGIEVIKMSSWDRWISSYSLQNPHRILYTWNKNLVLGTDMFSDTTSLDFYYVKQDKMNHIDAEFSIGTQFKYGDLTAIAY